MLIKKINIWLIQSKNTLGSLKILDLIFKSCWMKNSGLREEIFGWEKKYLKNDQSIFLIEILLIINKINKKFLQHINTKNGMFGQYVSMSNKLPSIVLYTLGL